MNHEFVLTPTLIGKPTPTNLDEVRVLQHAHGVSIVEIARINGSWRTVPSSYARRIHVNTPVKFGGPTANSDLLLTPAGNKPQGTLNNCSSGFTPWATYLTCEENFNGYFGVQKNTAWQSSESEDRYGFNAMGFSYFWHRFDPRFDLSNPDYLNESNRFGWIVEIDPFDVNQVPVKRTALGRFKHEGAAVTVGKGGRVVVYMGDDQQFDYIYKFVSDNDWQAMRRKRRSPLDHGKLYVARFNDDYTGDWLELSHDNPKLKEHFSDQAEILVYARLAADKAGATPMDRPEWTTVAPDGVAYCTCTNNTQRQEATHANPTAPNIAGHIIRWRDEDNHIGTKFKWDIFKIAADTHGTEASFSSPDGLWADPDGRLFIETDGQQEAGRNDQLLVADTHSGEIRQLLSGVKEAEITGITTTPDRKTLFINIQHSGGNTPKPFPRLDDKGMPRDATLAITRKNGGIVGS